MSKRSPSLLVEEVIESASPELMLITDTEAHCLFCCSELNAMLAADGIELILLTFKF